MGDDTGPFDNTPNTIFFSFSNGDDTAGAEADVAGGGSSELDWRLNLLSVLTGGSGAWSESESLSASFAAALTPGFAKLDLFCWTGFSAC